MCLCQNDSLSEQSVSTFRFLSCTDFPCLHEDMWPDSLDANQVIGKRLQLSTF
jgi:hypothetical protein